MRVERPVVAADAGVVAPDDLVRAAVVLPEQRVQQRLARAGVAHVERIARLHHGARPEVLLDQHGDGARAHLGRDVARLEVAEQRVHQHAVAGLDRHLGEVLVRAVHGIARLEGGDARPAEPLELGARLGGRHEQRAVLRLEAAVREHLHRSGEVDLALLPSPSSRPGCAGSVVRNTVVHSCALSMRVLLGDRMVASDLAVVRIEQRDLRAGPECRRGCPVRGQRDRDRPEQAARHAVAVAHAFPVGARHEALERREAADAEHDEIALLARAHAHRAQRPGARAFGGERLAGEHQRLERFASVRRYQSGHQFLTD